MDLLNRKKVVTVDNSHLKKKDDDERRRLAALAAEEEARLKMLRDAEMASVLVLATFAQVPFLKPLGLRVNIAQPKGLKDF